MIDKLALFRNAAAARRPNTQQNKLFAVIEWLQRRCANRPHTRGAQPQR
jgi:hypothetical protein